MRDLARASVVVVSRGRPAHLRRCLAGIAQSDHPDFEVVVVADPAGCGVAAGLPLKCVPFDAANIAAARNAGITASAGEVVAFIDDDAVPEPTWLSRLSAAFDQRVVGAATGMVRGRNGISLQTTLEEIDPAGFSHDWAHAHGCPIPDRICTVAPRPGHAIKCAGTNMAFRRSLLLRIGGFDPAFRFYLDDADISTRIAPAGALTAFVPDAHVHHAFAASDRRRADRVPLDLGEIGASLAVFLRRHAGGRLEEAAVAAMRADQRHRMIRHMVAGRIGPDEVRPILASLDRGLAEGAARALPAITALTGSPPAFLRCPSSACPGIAVAGRIWQAGRLRRIAARAVAEGSVASLFLFSPSARFHRIRFTDSGVWEQIGGLFGRSRRSDPLFRWVQFGQRLDREVADSRKFRPVSARQH